MEAELEIQSVEFVASRCRTRLPFRFGRVTLTEAPVIVARLRARVDGAQCEGMAGDLCVPNWFEKDPSKSSRDDVRSLFASARRAGRAFEAARGTPFAIWRAAHQRATAGDLATGIPLVDGFGIALVERAMIDTTCRALGSSFRDLLLGDRLGFDAGELLPELRGRTTSGLVADPAPPRVLVRHTVGGLDPLRRSEVSPELRGKDGHPVALEEDIDRFGLRAFKLKAGGEPEADATRLAAIARVVAEQGVLEPLYTLDANESYHDPRQVEELLDRLEADPDGRAILDGLAYLEQPLPRARTLDPETATAMHALARRVPLLIDEADDTVDAFARALELGYRGVSVKNCKGVFRALANRALCLAHGDGAFQTSEDLTNLPVLPLQQDLATVAALGLPHSERNGHHFFPGLDVVPTAEAESALAHHPDLYTRQGDRTVLRIEHGAISLACQAAKGYGYEARIDWSARGTLEAVAEDIPV